MAGKKCVNSSSKFQLEIIINFNNCTITMDYTSNYKTENCIYHKIKKKIFTYLYQLNKLTPVMIIRSPIPFNKVNWSWK